MLQPFGGDRATPIQAYLDVLTRLIRQTTETHIPEAAPPLPSPDLSGPGMPLPSPHRRGSADLRAAADVVKHAAGGLSSRRGSVSASALPSPYNAALPSPGGGCGGGGCGGGGCGGGGCSRRGSVSSSPTTFVPPTPVIRLVHTWPSPARLAGEMSRRLNLVHTAVARGGDKGASKEAASKEWRAYCAKVGRARTVPPPLHTSPFTP
jgi:hypothetical protein